MLSHSGSDPDTWHVSAAPGGPWIKRDTSSSALLAAAKHVARPPLNEAAAVAWKARRKPTIQGQVGTGNKISSVVQYPISGQDPHNLCRGIKNHLSAEDRRILRVRVKHHMRGQPSYPDCVYMVENQLMKTFARNPEFCAAFYTNDDFAEDTLLRAAQAYEKGGFGANDLRSGVAGSPEGEIPGAWRASFALQKRAGAAGFVDSVALLTKELSMNPAANATRR
mmetsp:Transcript_7474/g.16837  ORF Transcript_7474/g.16837 Transcript_7474/m.16837 type:complete len:223 (-) Transcript_7474:222-890(-)